MRRSGKIGRPILRFVASVLITSGVLMLIDAVLTVTWQEPVSAFFAQQEQNGLNDELEREAPRVEEDKRAVASIRDVRKRLERLAGLAEDRAETGHAIGKIRMPKLDREYAIVEGTDTDSLRKGPGHYPDTSFPGQGGTVAIAGHRTTYGAPFNDVDKLKRGDEIVLEMPYGKFTYEVEKQEIVDPSQTSVTDRVPGAERLVLSACHPLYSASQRIIVFARLRAAEPD
jgi:sortase A